MNIIAFSRMSLIFSYKLLGNKNRHKYTHNNVNCILRPFSMGFSSNRMKFVNCFCQTNNFMNETIRWWRKINIKKNDFFNVGCGSIRKSSKTGTINNWCYRHRFVISSLFICILNVLMNIFYIFLAIHHRPGDDAFKNITQLTWIDQLKPLCRLPSFAIRWWFNQIKSDIIQLVWLIKKKLPSNWFPTQSHDIKLIMFNMRIESKLCVYENY